jgi:hypothetical protein
MSTVTFIALKGVECALALATLSCLAACRASLYNPPLVELFAYNASPYGLKSSSSILSLTPVIGSLIAFPNSYQNTSSLSGVDFLDAHKTLSDRFNARASPQTASLLESIRPRGVNNASFVVAADVPSSFPPPFASHR